MSVSGVFFKQKTAYEMLRSLVGSEMCIRDRTSHRRDARSDRHFGRGRADSPRWGSTCLLYTSDAADDLTRVDVGVRRFFQAEDGIRDAQESRGLGDVYKRQDVPSARCSLRPPLRSRTR